MCDDDVAQGDIEDDDLETKLWCSFVSDVSFEDVFEIRVVGEEDVDDFSYVKGLKPILNLVAQATLPENVADYPSQQNARRPTGTWATLCARSARSTPRNN